MSETRNGSTDETNCNRVGVNKKKRVHEYNKIQVGGDRNCYTGKIHGSLTQEPKNKRDRRLTSSLLNVCYHNDYTKANLGSRIINES